MELITKQELIQSKEKEIEKDGFKRESNISFVKGRKRIVRCQCGHFSKTSKTPTMNKLQIHCEFCTINFEIKLP